MFQNKKLLESFHCCRKYHKKNTDVALQDLLHAVVLNDSGFRTTLLDLKSGSVYSKWFYDRSHSFPGQLYVCQNIWNKN